MRHLLPPSAAIAALLLLPPLAACGDYPATGPRDELGRLAQQFAELAGKPGGESDPTFAMAMEAASDVLRAGGAIGSVEARVDGAPTTFRAIAFQTLLSPAACAQQQAQERAIFPNDPALPCPAFGGMIAWQQTGERVDRVLAAVADSGATRFDFQGLDEPIGGGGGGGGDTLTVVDTIAFGPLAFGEFYERNGGPSWMTVNGTLSQSTLSLGQPCRDLPQMEPGMEVACVTASYRHSYDMRLQRWDPSDVFVPGIGGGGGGGGGAVPTKHIQIAAQTIPGLRFTITRLPDLPTGLRPSRIALRR